MTPDAIRTIDIPARREELKHLDRSWQKLPRALAMLAEAWEVIEELTRKDEPHESQVPSVQASGSESGTNMDRDLWGRQAASVAVHDVPGVRTNPETEQPKGDPMTTSERRPVVERRSDEDLWYVYDTRTCNEYLHNDGEWRAGTNYHRRHSGEPHGDFPDQQSVTNDAGTQTATDLGLQPAPAVPTIDELTAIIREACREWSRNQSWGEPGMYAAVARAIADKLAYHRTATERQLNADLSAANREVEQLRHAMDCAGITRALIEEVKSDRDKARAEVERLKGELGKLHDQLHGAAKELVATERDRDAARRELATIEGVVVNFESAEELKPEGDMLHRVTRLHDRLIALTAERTAANNALTTARRELAEAREELDGLKDDAAEILIYLDSLNSGQNPIGVVGDSLGEQVACLGRIAAECQSQLTESQAGAAAMRQTLGCCKAMCQDENGIDNGLWTEHHEMIDAALSSTAGRALTEAHAAEVGELKSRIATLIAAGNGLVESLLRQYAVPKSSAMDVLAFKSGLGGDNEKRYNEINEAVNAWTAAAGEVGK